MDRLLLYLDSVYFVAPAAARGVHTQAEHAIAADMTNIWPADPALITRAAERLAAGGLVGVPTETVYGLAADASNGEAVAKIYETKGRPRFNPLIVHVADANMAARIGEIGQDAARLIERYWPGPLTIVLPALETAPISDLAMAGLPTVALRSPAHPVARALLTEFGKPFVAPSANRSGRISPTTADHVAEEFGDLIPVLDGGPCEVGVESTIIGLAADLPALLRPGSIDPMELSKVLGIELIGPGAGIVAPGMMTSHYAPDAAVRLEAEEARGNEVLLGFGGTPGATLDLSPSGDLREAAAHLFSYLRQLDRTGKPIAVAKIPDKGLGLAINDRLRRAAAPRD